MDDLALYSDEKGFVMVRRESMVGGKIGIPVPTSVNQEEEIKSATEFRKILENYDYKILALLMTYLKQKMTEYYTQKCLNQQAEKENLTPEMTEKYITLIDTLLADKEKKNSW